MKVSMILSLLGLLASTSIATPSHSEKKDVNIFLYELALDHAGMTAGPVLRPGTYIITSLALPPEFVIGRGIEDRSLNPKKIKTVPTWDRNSQIKVIPPLAHILLLPHTNIL
jgi:hypothetical protein